MFCVPLTVQWYKNKEKGDSQQKYHKKNQNFFNKALEISFIRNNL